MKHLTFSITISVLVILFAGCSMPCFYQAGKSIEQCEQDLLECAYSDRPTRLCMQDRGYQYLDANTFPLSRKRKKIVVLFQESAGSGDRKAMSEEYWVVDGRDMSSDNFRLVLEPGTQITDPDAQPGKLAGYRIRQDDFGKFTKTPVYDFRVVLEPGTQTTDPDAQPGKLAGYRIQQDDFGKFTKTPVYDIRVASEPVTQITDPDAPPGKLAGYRIWQDDFGKFTKTPVYDFRVASEPVIQTTDPNAPPKIFIGYRVRQDKFGKFTRTPIFKDE